MLSCKHVIIRSRPSLRPYVRERAGRALSPAPGAALCSTRRRRGEPGAERRAGRPSSRQVQDSIGAQAASKAALGPGPEPRAGAAGREHGEDQPFDTAEHYGRPARRVTRRTTGRRRRLRPLRQLGESPRRVLPTPIYRQTSSPLLPLNETVDVFSAAWIQARAAASRCC